MPKRSLAEQLDQAVQALLKHPDSAPSSTDAQLRELLAIAAELRELPRKEFKDNLKDDLQRRAQMSTTAVNPIRQGFHTLTPYLIVPRAAEVLEFAHPEFGVHDAAVRLGDSMLEIGEANEQFSPLPASIHLKVEDVDAVYAKALEAGGVSLYPPTDHEYGERDGGVKDPGGNHWYIGSPRGKTHFLPDQRSVTPCLHITGATGCIDFLKQAFGAEEVMRHQSPDGILRHAKMRLGDTVVEMSEARREFPAMPANLHLYVADTDAVYQRALAAGATSVREPRDEPYGDRSGGVRDPFGNVWWIATHIRDVAF